MSAVFMFCGVAAAQPISATQQACDTYAAPAFIKQHPKSNTVTDCRCMSGFLVGRYGDADGAAITRIFAAATADSPDEMANLRKSLGEQRLKAIVAKVGTFKKLGHDMDSTCPPIPRP